MEGLLIETPPLDVYAQMAFDENAAAVCGGNFLLRVYNWSGEGVTFGYAQFFDEVVQTLPSGAAVTRRPTGGGIVPHGDDMTFSCIFPPQGALSPTALYAKLHGAFYRALASLGVECALHGADGAGKSGGALYAPSAGGAASACFRNPVPLDLLDGRGVKILGGALRRFEGAVLYQGSLQMKGARARAAQTAPAFAAELSKLLGFGWEKRAAADSELAAAEKLAAERYRSPEWIEKF